MAMLTLDKLWINLLDTGSAISCYSSRSKTLTKSMSGDVRQYAGGRQRAVASKGVKGSFSFTLEDVSQAQIDTLTSWIGQTVVIRDVRGRRFFGVYFDLGISDRASREHYVVTLVLNEVTYTEGS